MLKVLQTATVLLGLPLLLLGLGWWVHPGPAAELLGAELLNGTGRSTQIGDSGAFFIGSGLFLVWGAIRCNATLVLVGGLLIGLVMPGRALSVMVHGGAWTIDEIIGEAIILGVALLTASALPQQSSQSTFR